VTEAAATLVLVRHGQIAANAERIWHGSTDSALTERGRGEAERTARHLAQRAPAPAALYTSPLLRARETAGPIAAELGLAARVEPGRGMASASSRRLVPGARSSTASSKIADPDCAARESPSWRVSAAAIARAHRGEQVVVVSHGRCVGCARSLIERDANQWQLPLRRTAASSARAGPAFIGTRSDTPSAARNEPRLDRG
jgi:probable phosphoglycerate mutase